MRRILSCALEGVVKKLSAVTWCVYDEEKCVNAPEGNLLELFRVYMTKKSVLMHPKGTC